MSKIVVANCTSQNHVLCYQLPDDAKIVQQPVGMGRQEYVGGPNADLSGPDVEAFVRQLTPYGLIRAEDANRLPNKIVTYIWSEKPIKLDVIKRVMDHNKGVHVDTGGKRRERAALGINDALKNVIQEADAPKVELFTLEVEEVDSESAAEAHENAGSKPVGQGFEIDGKAGTGPANRTRRQGGNRSR